MWDVGGGWRVAVTYVWFTFPFKCCLGLGLGGLCMWLSYSHCVVALLVLFVLLFGGWCGMWVVRGGAVQYVCLKFPFASCLGLGGWNRCIVFILFFHDVVA